MFLAGPCGAQAPADAKYVTNEIRVTGNVERTLTLSVADLKRLPVQQLEDRRTVGSTRAVSRKRFAGSPGAGCATSSMPRDSPRKVRRDLRKSYVVASASDDYRVVFSWGELYNSPVGDGVLVVYEIDGAPLPDSEGRIALVSLKDARPGPRHVKWLARVDVRLAD